MDVLSYGSKAVLKLSPTVLKMCVKEEVAVPGSPSLIAVRTVSVDVKQR